MQHARDLLTSTTGRKEKEEEAAIYMHHANTHTLHTACID
jgi:hypothetical protein